MPIVYHESSKEFHIHNEELSYIIRIMENGQPENLYYGKRLRDRDSFAHLHEELPRPLTPLAMPEPTGLSMLHVKHEYPSYGAGDFRSPAFQIRQENGSRISDFRYVSHEITAGKKPLTPLPATYVGSDDEAASLYLTLYDELTKTKLILSYTVYEGLPVVCRNARFLQEGEETLYLERALSASMEFPDKDFEMLHLNGTWSRERHVKTRRLEAGIQSIQSLCGASSAEHNPFLALMRPNADENRGEVYGFSFVYSGNFLAQVEVDSFELTRVMMGIHPQEFTWKLEPGEQFQTPEVVMVYSDEGLGKMSRTYHKLYRKRLVRGKWRDLPRPILLNNWEATYFDFDEEKLLKIVSKAKDAGIELFVLDDGWFGSRKDDFRALGDWVVNTDKLPGGISGLSKKVNDMGLQFGLWVELEMISKESDLYNAHPDWLLSTPGRFESPARHQHVLNFSRPDVVDAIYEMIEKVIAEASISYIKWDMNRYLSEAYSSMLDSDRQGELMHRHILGVYDLYTRLIARFPDILFESCASGGARFDPGMLYFAPQAWTSDDTDAMERVKIQYGTSMVYPLSSMGSHVSAVPNHQVMRTTSIDTRANVAYFGTFGYELDLNQIPQEDFEKVKRQVAFMKENRRLIQLDGEFFRIKNPFGANDAAWMVVSEDQRQALFAYYQYLMGPNPPFLRVKLKGLDENLLYTVTCGDRVYRAYGDELMYAGLPVDHFLLHAGGGDFASLLYEICAVEG